MTWFVGARHRRAQPALVRQLLYQRTRSKVLKGHEAALVVALQRKSDGVRRLIEHVAVIPAGARVLEVGSGSHGLIFYFNSQGPRVGIDPLAVDYARLFPSWQGRARTCAASGAAVPGRRVRRRALRQRRRSRRAAGCHRARDRTGVEAAWRALLHGQRAPSGVSICVVGARRVECGGRPIRDRAVCRSHGSLDASWRPQDAAPASGTDRHGAERHRRRPGVRSHSPGAAPWRSTETVLVRERSVRSRRCEKGVGTDSNGPAHIIEQHDDPHA